MAETYQSAPTPVLTGDTPLPKPQEVTQGVRLFYASFALALLGGIIGAIVGANRAAATTTGAPGAAAGIGAGVGIVIVVIALAIDVLILMQADKGKNWARIVLTVFFGIGLLVALPSLAASFAISPFTGILSIVQLVLGAAALYFLWRPAASAWYKSIR